MSYFGYDYAHWASQQPPKVPPYFTWGAIVCVMCGLFQMALSLF